jgi:hypothetical protein
MNEVCGFVEEVPWRATSERKLPWAARPCAATLLPPGDTDSDDHLCGDHGLRCSRRSHSVRPVLRCRDRDRCRLKRPSLDVDQLDSTQARRRSGGRSYSASDYLNTTTPIWARAAKKRTITPCSPQTRGASTAAQSPTPTGTRPPLATRHRRPALRTDPHWFPIEAALCRLIGKDQTGPGR